MQNIVETPKNAFDFFFFFFFMKWKKFSSRFFFYYYYFDTNIPQWAGATTGLQALCLIEISNRVG